ncbi:MAG TPA: NADH-quinone oxidoreductase subunit C [Humidesulfovibrio sp.]|uniref:hydrogenase large subunit n=1 Tax=Humidesulfovibrio sp. TaxID=2910988 RepID=UPI002BA55994|nr:NADH-quinone oxidoreductase subunit C [Humidesulfovibrio sp.]HWR05165.1 NADH-quinone oxidoreductase subunit C [Humidesulfovibrio sp.]
MRNAQAIPLRAVPVLPAEEFCVEVLEAVLHEARLSALFCAPVKNELGNDELRLFAVLAEDRLGTLHVLSAPAGQAYPSLTPDCPQAHLFEREIWETWGVTPLGHPWLKPVRFPQLDPQGREIIGPEIGQARFMEALGEGGHEVAVGPVHAGIIEPGHFRFLCHGEDVLHLEISLGYQHRGVERALVNGPGPRFLQHMQTLAGDTTIGHSTAACQNLEALSGCRVPAGALVLRAIALELERLANHAGDLGALALDVGFLPTSSFLGRIRGDFLNMTARLCGSRFGRGLIKPGGVGFDLDAARAEAVRAHLAEVFPQCVEAVELLWSTPSVVSRFERTGVVSRVDALALGLVGVAARACDVEIDVRQDFPVGAYAYSHIPVAVSQTGDVAGRAFVRHMELLHSEKFLTEHLTHLPGCATACGFQASPGNLAPEHLAVSLVEGWRGEICHVAITDEAGRFAAYKVVDPSFHNWAGLSMALRNQQISDFPICNKSFNLSYCGHDL